MFPIAESIGVVLRVTADHGDECEEEEDENKDNFSAGEPEFGLAISFYCKAVEKTRETCQLKTCGEPIQAQALEVALGASRKGRIKRQGKHQSR
jgi:hypothetical protein